MIVSAFDDPLGRVGMAIVSSRSAGSGKSASRGNRKSEILFGSVTQSEPHSVAGTPS